MAQREALLIISHGSRSPDTLEEIRDLTEKVRISTGADLCLYAFLEIQTPSIPEGIDQCVDRGADRIVVVLNFLNAGRHVDQDIPEILEAARLKYPHVKITHTKPLGQYAGIADVFRELIRDAKTTT